MNLLDLALVAIVALSVVTAASRGFVYEVWMMAATVVAIGVAAWQYPAVVPWLGWIGGEEARHFAAFVVVLGAVLLAAMALGRVLRRLLHAVGLGGVDRLLGAGLGLVRGVVLGAVVVFMLVAYPFNPRLVRGSALAPGFLWGSRALARVMPSALEGRFRTGLRAEAAELGKEMQ